MNIALYRRYRPDTFATVIGQEQVTRPLMAALDAGRINHAYLFSGPRGCGKTTCARIMARCLNCAEGPTSNPCGKCPSCVELATGACGSLDVVEIDAASHNGVDDARELRERAAFAPVRDRFKIFILDEAHMVTSQGFNALLKLVEEPPEHVKFIFATTEPEKVIGTIRSRTHHYPFRLVAPDILRNFLADLCTQESIETDEGVLELVIRAGGGSVRDSLSVLDQLMAGAREGKLDYQSAVGLLGYTDSTLLQEVVDAIIDQDCTALFRHLENVIESGLDPRRFLEDLLLRLRDLMLLGFSGSEVANLATLPQGQLDYMKTQVQRWNPVGIARAADLTASTITGMTGTVAPRLQIELLGAKLLSLSTVGTNSAGTNPVETNPVETNSAGKINPLGNHANRSSAPMSRADIGASSQSQAQAGADIEASMAAARAVLAASRKQNPVAPQIVSSQEKSELSVKQNLTQNLTTQSEDTDPQPTSVSLSNKQLENMSENKQTEPVARSQSATVEADTAVISVAVTPTNRLRTEMPRWELEARIHWPEFSALLEEDNRKLFCILNLVCEPRFTKPGKLEIAVKDSGALSILKEHEKLLVKVAKSVYPNWEIEILEQYQSERPLAVDFYQSLQLNKSKNPVEDFSKVKTQVAELASDGQKEQDEEPDETQVNHSDEDNFPGLLHPLDSDSTAHLEDTEYSDTLVQKNGRNDTSDMVANSVEPKNDTSDIVANSVEPKNDAEMDSDWILPESEMNSEIKNSTEPSVEDFAAGLETDWETVKHQESVAKPADSNGEKTQAEGAATDWVINAEENSTVKDSNLGSTVTEPKTVTEPATISESTTENSIAHLAQIATAQQSSAQTETFLSEEDEISFDDEDAEPLITDVDQVLKQVLRAKKIEEINLQE